MISLKDSRNIPGISLFPPVNVWVLVQCLVAWDEYALMIFLFFFSSS